MFRFRIFSPKLVVTALKRASKLDIGWNLGWVTWKAASHTGSAELHRLIDSWQMLNGSIGSLLAEVGVEFVEQLMFEFSQPDSIAACTFLLANALRERLEGRNRQKTNILPMDED